MKDPKISALQNAIRDLYVRDQAMWAILRQLGVAEGQIKDAIIKAQSTPDATMPSGVLSGMGRAG